MPKVSILIPSRNEQFLCKTVEDLLAKARGDTEIIVVQEGYWEHQLPADPRVRQLHHGRAQGMRVAINRAVQMSRSPYLLKCDAHTMWDEGFDVTLLADYHEDNWILTPRRYALDAENWAWDESNAKYPIDYESFSWPWNHPDHPLTGFHGLAWTARRDARKHIPLDRDLSSQGSAWFMSRRNWDRIGPMRVDLFGEFFSESQEIGLGTQLRGGEMMRTKNTWYAHLRKSTKYGRGYSMGSGAHRRGAILMLRRVVLEEWPDQTRKFADLIRDFWPLPGWPEDWEKQLAEKLVEYLKEAAA